MVHYLVAFFPTFGPLIGWCFFYAFSHRRKIHVWIKKNDTHKRKNAWNECRFLQTRKNGTKKLCMNERKTAQRKKSIVSNVFYSSFSYWPQCFSAKKNCWERHKEKRHKNEAMCDASLENCPMLLLCIHNIGMYRSPQCLPGLLEVT